MLSDTLMAALVSAIVSLGVSAIQMYRQNQHIDRQLQANRRLFDQKTLDDERRFARERVERIDTLTRRMIKVENVDPHNDLDIIQQLNYLLLDIRRIGKLLTDATWKPLAEDALKKYRIAITDNTPTIDTLAGKNHRLHGIRLTAESLAKLLQ